MAQVDAAHAVPGTELTVHLPGGRRSAARVTEHLARYDPEGERLRPSTDAPVSPVRDTGSPISRSPVVLTAPATATISMAYRATCCTASGRWASTWPVFCWMQASSSAYRWMVIPRGW
ncbi:MAG: hypothetical protein ACRDRK_06115 [Pseudonocardia sp.]